MIKEYDIIAIGELNVDIILNQIDGFPQIGKEIFSKKMDTVLGSSTAILAANAAALGLKIAIVSMIGKDSFGDIVCNELVSRGVDISHVSKHNSIPTGATISMSYGDNRANITYQGTMDILSFADIDSELFKKARHIHVSSIFMQAGIKRDLLELLKYAKYCGATTSLDPQWDPNEEWDFNYEEILPLVDVFLPNQAELAAITREPILTNGINRIKRFANVCIVKQGTKGSTLFRPQHEVLYQASFINAHIVDTIGAGDSFNAGFLYKYLKGHSLDKCQRFGNLMGAINTTSTGGISAFETKEKIERTSIDVFKQNIIWQ